MTRLEEVRQGLMSVRERIARACQAADRAEGDVTLVVVTKFFPASDVRMLADLGVTDVGENRHQEAQAKAAECAGLGLRWHFIGGLQSNKAAAVSAYADVVESVDRKKLLAPLARGAAERGSRVEVLLQVSLDPPGSEHRSGVLSSDLRELSQAVDAHSELELSGLMAVAPLGEDPGRSFARLTEVRNEFLDHHPQAMVLSAGMSQDLEQAIGHGATHVRVGSAILGPRPVIL